MRNTYVHGTHEIYVFMTSYNEPFGNNTSSFLSEHLYSKAVFGLGFYGFNNGISLLFLGRRLQYQQK